MAPTKRLDNLFLLRSCGGSAGDNCAAVGTNRNEYVQQVPLKLRQSVDAAMKRRFCQYQGALRDLGEGLLARQVQRVVA